MPAIRDVADADRPVAYDAVEQPQVGGGEADVHYPHLIDRLHREADRPRAAVFEVHE